MLIRWQVVSVKKPCWASDSNEFAVQGAAARSSVIWTTPLANVSVTASVPVAGTPVPFGGSTTLAGAFVVR